MTIDTSVLPHLTDENLKELGISLGHRVKLLAAIRELGVTLRTVEPTVTPTEPKPQDAAERRQVTVMFSDLVGSTALSARMDPEDLREVISAYQKCVSDTVRRFDGFVAKYLGDGVLVYFGYPQAHEDDAERAVRAGLELIVQVADHDEPGRDADPRLQRSAGLQRTHRSETLIPGDQRGAAKSPPVRSRSRLLAIDSPRLVITIAGLGPGR